MGFREGLRRLYDLLSGKSGHKLVNLILSIGLLHIILLLDPSSKDLISIGSVYICLATIVLIVNALEDFLNPEE